jgi:hypothetical protein
MGDRYWIWLGVRLLMAVAIIGWAASYVGGRGSGEREFQKTLEAMKQVHSFRVVSTVSQGNQRNELLFEVDCNRNIVHRQMHAMADTTNPASTFDQDDVEVANQVFDRQKDGSWSKPQYAAVGSRQANWFCTSLTQGTDNGLMPRLATMIQRGIIQKGDKKTVNGVRCREWLVTMRGAPGGLEHDTVCLGLEDGLPYEATIDWQHARANFSDYNAPIQFDLPEAAVQATGAAAQNP